jgi:hypothetical protein
MVSFFLLFFWFLFLFISGMNLCSETKNTIFVKKEISLESNNWGGLHFFYRIERFVGLGTEWMWSVSILTNVALFKECV